MLEGCTFFRKLNIGEQASWLSIETAIMATALVEHIFSLGFKNLIKLFLIVLCLTKTVTKTLHMKAGMRRSKVIMLLLLTESIP